MLLDHCVVGGVDHVMASDTPLIPDTGSTEHFALVSQLPINPENQGAFGDVRVAFYSGRVRRGASQRQQF